MPAFKNSSGFSLTELLVSLVVLSLISLASISALSVGKKIWSKAGTVPEMSLRDAELVYLRHVLSRKIAGSSNVGGGVQGSQRQLVFRGLSNFDGNHFLTSQISLTLDQNGLEIRSRSGNKEKSTLLKHLLAEEMTFYGNRGQSIEYGWSKRWDATDPAPKLVRFKFSDSPSQTVNNEIVVAFP